ncbi:MAG TPA: GNAT family protein [Acidimicrobiales bacterium]|jgi:RimJ/RimL family protein N-acetyltransferase
MDDVTLRPIAEADLDDLYRFSTDPEAGGEFEWTGFKDPKAVRRRWDEDGWIGNEHVWLAVARPDGTFAGIVSWKDRPVGPTKGLRYEVGIALLPEHRGQGVGTTAQRLMVQYLFDHTPVHRLEAYTDVENVVEQRALEKAGFQREGVLQQIYFRAGRWRDSVLYSRLRDTPESTMRRN